MTGDELLEIYWEGKTDFSGHDFCQSDLSGLRVSAISFANANFTGANVKGGRFEEINFQQAILKNTNLEKTDFRNCDFTGADFSGADLRQAIFEQCNIAGANFSQAILIDAEFRDTNKANANFEHVIESPIDLLVWEEKITNTQILQTIQRFGDGHGRYKKFVGHNNAFADITIWVEPYNAAGQYSYQGAIYGTEVLVPERNIVLHDCVSPQAIPTTYRSGIKEAIKEEKGNYGILSNLSIFITGGQYHEIDSSAATFKLATALALTDVFAKTGITLLDAIYLLEIPIKEAEMGEVINMFSKYKGRTEGMDSMQGYHIIKGMLPYRKKALFDTDLNLLMGKKAKYNARFSHYDKMDHRDQEQLMK